MQEFEGRTAVVTGAASGIGLATARALAAEGMRVVLADIEEGALAKAEAELAGAGHEVLAVRTDVSSFAEVERLRDRAVECFDAVHVLHNNAGVLVSGPVERLSLEDWEWVLGVNLWSAIYGIKAFLPVIKAAGEGHVVSTASTAGLSAPAVIAPYSVAKFGIVALSETLRHELEAESSPIGASVLCPGPVKTNLIGCERNRPEPSARTHESSPVETAFMEGSRKLLASRGLPPDRVAALVVQAIRDGRFWILPHPEWIELLRERVEGMADGGRLATASLA